MLLSVTEAYEVVFESLPCSEPCDGPLAWAGSRMQRVLGRTAVGPCEIGGTRKRCPVGLL